jgi:hypothetical protein
MALIGKRVKSKADQCRGIDHCHSVPSEGDEVCVCVYVCGCVTLTERVVRVDDGV